MSDEKWVRRRRTQQQIKKKGRNFMFKHSEDGK